MKKLTLSALATAASLLIVTNLQSQNNSETIEKIRNYAQKVREDWKIPGMSLSIVKDGKLIFAEGFGFKEMGKQAKVDASTVYQIGSVSKSFTATIMASLVDEGKVKWDDTVKNILPDFEMYDKWVTENIQVKDIMTHRTGLKGQMGTYIPNMGYEREDIYKMLKLMKPAYSFRGSYEYNNITFIIAEKIIEKVTGKSWEQNIQERVFDKLGMTSSSVNGSGFAEAENVAVPHEFYYSRGKKEIDSMVVNPMYGEEQALHWLTVIGPAGSVNSTVEDMSKYIMFHMDKGKFGGEQVVSTKNMNFLHRGLTITSQDSSRTTLYGNCWFVEQNNRYRVWFHTGTTWGMTALCVFVPELKLGMMLLCNSEVPSSPRYAVMRRLIDLYKGSPERDYNSEYLTEWASSERKSFDENVKKESDAAAEMSDETPSFKKLRGTYDKGELFGKALITMEKGELYITVGPKGWKNKLVHKKGNKFSFRSDGHSFPVTFEINPDNGKAISLDIDFGYGENFGKWIKQF